MPKSTAYQDIELFAGAGGLAIGLSSMGLAPDHLFELDRFCCETLEHNSSGTSPLVTGKVHREEVADVDWEDFTDRPVRLLTAGPPCQPFSCAGKHRAEQDERNEFPATFRAIRCLRPAAVLIENVHGLGRPSFRPYLDYILRQLELPSVEIRSGESWQDHDIRLYREQGSCSYEPEYSASWRLLNSADYGVPQTRSRVFIVAARSGLPQVALPRPTHSMEALVRDQENGVYWERHRITPPRYGRKRRGAPGYVRDTDSVRSPWRTVREALAGLEQPPPESDPGRTNHWLIPGARLYPPKHAGSDIDWPSKTIKAGVHGVAGGENIVRWSARSFRYYTLREMARLQGFPDQHYFKGPRSRVIGQIGNAVPCQLARAVAGGLRETLGAFEACLDSSALARH